MALIPTDSRFFSTVSRFPPCPHPPHQSTAPRLSPLPLISAPTSPLGTSGPQLCERLRCRGRSRGGGEWGLLMGLAEAIEDVFGVEDGGAVVRWIYRQPHRSEWRGVGIRVKVGQGDAPHLVFLHRLIDTRPNGHTAQLSQALSPPFPIPSRSASLFPPPPAMMHLSAQYLLLTYRFLAHKSPTSATWAHCSQGTRGLPSALLPGLHRTFLSPPLPSFLSSSTPLFTSFTPASPTPTSGLLKPRSYAPHLLLPRHLLPHGLPHTHGTGALLTQEEVAAMAELHGRLQAKLGEARLLGSPWRFLRMAGQREEEVRPNWWEGRLGPPWRFFRSDEQREEEVRSGWVTPPSAPCPLATCSSEGEGEWAREVAAAVALRWLAALGVDSGEEGEGGEGKGEDEGDGEG
ncbi:unnamed protein product [Closterium sp. NIES-65]|nr:unnamed protein product [Closterium sp. NIES-65]